jgi:hypothetical protein
LFENAAKRCQSGRKHAERRNLLPGVRECPTMRASPPHRLALPSLSRLGVFVLAASMALLALPSASHSQNYESARGLYAALANQKREVIKIGGGEINLVFADGAPGVHRAKVRAWVRKSAEAVTTYFGGFPVKTVGLLVIAGDGKRIGGGTTYGFETSAIRIHVGREAGDAEFARDWVMVHEMVHLALPTVEENSWWLLEGSATYIEPIARAQAGQLPITKVWGDTIRDMPQGLPQAGDKGLDFTPTHDRIYWGGALYFMLADVMIREQTNNRLGLRDALRAVNAQSGGNIADWPIADVVRVGDAATGTQVMTTLYQQMRDKPNPVDLAALFTRLGVRRSGDDVLFDDSAPAAAIRRAITKR